MLCYSSYSYYHCTILCYSMHLVTSDDYIVEDLSGRIDINAFGQFLHDISQIPVFLRPR